MEYGETCIGPGLISSLLISAPWGLKGGAQVEIRSTEKIGRQLRWVFDAIVPHFEFRPATLSIQIESRCWMAGSSARTDNGRAFRMPRRMSTRRTYNQAMISRPQTTEAAPYYFNYIDQVTGDDPLGALENQLEEALFSAISEEKSLHRYAPDKWSIRQVLNHVTDTERAFTFRALWFARGLESPLPSYDQNVAASGAEADRVSWAAHVE